MSKSDFYIFLDIDGVLNNHRTILNFGALCLPRTWAGDFCQRSVGALNYLINYLSFGYNPQLVLSSTRRIFRYEQTKVELEQAGVEAEVIDKTPIYAFQNRCQEINDYILQNGVENFVILDDRAQALKNFFGEDQVIETDIKGDGLTGRHIREYIKNNFSTDDFSVHDSYGSDYRRTKPNEEDDGPAEFCILNDEREQ